MASETDPDTVKWDTFIGFWCWPRWSQHTPASLPHWIQLKPLHRTQKEAPNGPETHMGLTESELVEQFPLLTLSLTDRLLN
jgi:hypothetical protein